MRYPDLEMDLLRAFVTVTESGGFTAAAEVIGRSQSAVSQKISRLERLVGRRLFDRTSRALSLTKDGEELLVSARQILELNDAAIRRMLSPPVVGYLKLGVTEDFIPRQLPSLLARFKRLYPSVRLELMTGLSCDLLAAYERGELDVLIAKKDGNAQRGRVIWREQLVWLAAAEFDPDGVETIPLVMLPAPCTYRRIMISSLDAARRPWTAACTAKSLIGIQAAVAGSLGVTVLGRSFVQDGLTILRDTTRWPPLPATEIVLIGEESAQVDLVRPLVSFLADELASASSIAA